MKKGERCRLKVRFDGTTYHSNKIIVEKGQSFYVPTPYHKFSRIDSHFFEKNLIGNRHKFFNFKVLPFTVEKTFFL